MLTLACSDVRCRVGTSFASLSSAFSIFNAFYSNGRCEPNTPCPEAWGALLGTSALCSLTEIGMSFVPAKTLRRLFPPIVTVSLLAVADWLTSLNKLSRAQQGLVVLLIGASLIGESGFLSKSLSGLRSGAQCATCLDTFRCRRRLGRRQQ